MIKANELRIGNLLHWEADHLCGGTCKVIMIIEFRFEVESLAGCYPLQEEYKDIVPIPLTPEWLERMGFEKFGNRYGRGDEPIDFGIDQENSFFYWNQSEISDVQLKYVHQLQNLYFALTGQELIVKA